MESAESPSRAYSGVYQEAVLKLCTWIALALIAVGFVGCGISVYAAVTRNGPLDDIGWWLSLPMHVVWAGLILVALVGLVAETIEQWPSFGGLRRKRD